MEKIILRYEEDVPATRTFLERLGDEYEDTVSPHHDLLHENKYFPIAHIADKRLIDEIIGRIDTEGYNLLFVDADKIDGGMIMYARKNGEQKTAHVL